MDQFPLFGNLVAKSFQKITRSQQVYVVGIDGDELYRQYLAAFPAGTDPVFKKTTEHNCSCCKHFIRRAGNVVTVVDGQYQTIWDEAAQKAPYPYNVVAGALRTSLLAAGITDLYRVSAKEIEFGAQKTRSLNAETGKAVVWDHFFTGPIEPALRVDSPDQVRGDYRTTVQVFTRGLVELSPTAVETVLGLIDANSLYRGQEHRAAVLQFQNAQREYSTKKGTAQAVYAWTNAVGPAARFRNTVIGTLVQDLSEGVDVERAVQSFETKVAPQNYKRTTAVITPGMVKKAMETITSLGLESALERRFAKISDISVQDVLWVDGASRPQMKGGLEEVLMKSVSASKNTPKDGDRAEPIDLDSFVKTVLPEASSVEILLKNDHLGNLMSLTAPVDPAPKQLFRWTNDFAWSYGGNVADSIKERVKKAGGRVDGTTLRVSLSWFNFDDLDLHIIEPQGRGVNVSNEIAFNHKIGWTGGSLDIDMNAGGGQTREAVENVVWTKKVPDGPYQIVVNNFAQRETSNVGFVIEVENGAKITHYSYNKAVRNKENVVVATLYMKDGAIDRVEAGNPGITAANISQTKWGLATEQYVKVNAVTLSPNYWGDNAVGNKHTFFVIDGCQSDEATRGIYNEFLNPRLEPHRKVFEIIGDKTKCQPTEGQLSGLGFSSTKKDSFTVKVQQGKRQRLYNVQVGT